MTVSFPVALHGSEAQVRKRVVTASRAWADDLREGAPLRALATSELAAGTHVFCSDVTAIVPGRAEWRAYGLGLVCAGVSNALDSQDDDEDRVDAALEDAFLRFPAGVLWLNVGRPEPTTLAIQERRIAALLDGWDPLDTLLYIDAQLQPQKLAAVIEDHYAAFLDIWLDAPSDGPLADRLRAANTTALAASEAVTRQRMAAACRRLARRWQRISTPEHFDDPAWVERQFAAVRRSEYEMATTGKALEALVYAMHRKGEREHSP